MNRAVIAVVLVAAIGAIALAQKANSNRVYQLKDLQVAQLKFGKKSIKAWVMDTGSKRQEGMMFLNTADVPKDHGMIFAFVAPQSLSFWMKNTNIPLDIAYLDAKGKAVSVHQMKAHDLNGVPSAAPAKYALEMVQGSFKRLGIVKGTTFTIPANVKAKD